MNQAVQHQLSILIVEDEYHTRMAVARKVQAAGHTVDMAEDSAMGLHMGLTRAYDAILLDLGLPGGGGLDLLVKLRKISQVPVIFISQFEGVEERLQALDSGADDFLVKPVDPRELIAKLRAIVRRAKTNPNQSVTLVSGDLEVNLVTRSARRAGLELDLSPTEFEILVLLARNPDRLLSRHELEGALANKDSEKAQKNNILDVYILRLRRKIGKERITNRRGLGFIFHG
jgi:two-component system OmpR family response regulator